MILVQRQLISLSSLLTCNQTKKGEHEVPTKPVTHSEAKSIADSLECSPSQHQPTSPIYSGSHDNPQAKRAPSGKSSADKEAEKVFGSTPRKTRSMLKAGSNKP